MNDSTDPEALGALIADDPGDIGDAALLRVLRGGVGGAPEREREKVFAQLVARHLPTVWGAAWRLTGGDHALSQDVAQQVMADVALKFGSAEAVSWSEVRSLGGWLHRHTGYVARKALRSESRRRQREKIASDFLMSTPHPAAEASADQATMALSHLDEALISLPAAERDLVVWRYLEGHSYRDMGCRLQCSEDTVRKRCDRALERLRERILKKCRSQSALSVVVLGTLLRQSTASVPVGLSAVVTRSAWKIASGASGRELPTTAALGPGVRAAWHRLSGPAAAGLATGAAAVVIALVAALAHVAGSLWERGQGGITSAGQGLAEGHQMPIRGQSGPLVRVEVIRVPDEVLSLDLLNYSPSADADANLRLRAQQMGHTLTLEKQAAAGQNKIRLKNNAHVLAIPSEIDRNSESDEIKIEAYKDVTLGTEVEVEVFAEEVPQGSQARWTLALSLTQRDEPLARWLSLNLSTPLAAQYSAAQPAGESLNLPMTHVVEFSASFAATAGTPVLVGMVKEQERQGRTPGARPQRVFIFLTLNPILPR